MYKIWNLTKRNCLVFLRDRGAVFFSLLSMLVVLALMGIFLGDINVEAAVELAKQYGGERNETTDLANATQLNQYWTLAGILVVNAVTVTLTVIGGMVSDAAGNRLADFYVAPVKKGAVGISYILAATLIGTMFCLLTLGIYMGYIIISGGQILTAAAVLKLTAYILLNVFVFSVVMYMLALFVKSQNAWSGLATIFGTLVGFLGAIYLPMGSLPDGVATVLKYLPVLHGGALMRQVCCRDILAKTFAGVPAEVIDVYKERMGITISYNE